MRVSSRSVAALRRSEARFAPNIYYFDPLLAGPRRSWPVHLRRCKALGFNHVVSAPLFDPGESGDLFLASDHERANPGIERLARLARAGAAGFRCEDPGAMPANLWRHVVASVKQRVPHSRFLAWTPGLDWRTIAALRDVGFDAAFSSVAWWDGRATWLA